MTEADRCPGRSENLTAAPSGPMAGKDSEEQRRPGAAGMVLQRNSRRLRQDGGASSAWIDRPRRRESRRGENFREALKNCLRDTGKSQPVQ